MISRKQVIQQMTARVRALLEQDSLPPWRRPWKTGYGSGAPYNPVTGRQYHGMNSFDLALSAALTGYDDPRWIGYRQAAQNGWQVRAGEHGTSIYLPVTVRADKNETESSPDAPSGLPAGEGSEKKRSFLLFKVVKVFNAAQIDGIPTLVPAVPGDAQANDAMQSARQSRVIEAVASVMGVSMKESPQDRAFYHVPSDQIITPPRDAFLSDAHFESTRLHELAHASGHPSRLARTYGKTFGDPEYAAEEVVAEITAWILSLEWGISFTGENPEDASLQDGQFALYAATWAKRINTEDGLEHAVSQALKATQYLGQQHANAVATGLIEEMPELRADFEPRAPAGPAEEDLPALTPH